VRLRAQKRFHDHRFIRLHSRHLCNIHSQVQNLLHLFSLVESVSTECLLLNLEEQRTAISYNSQINDHKTKLNVESRIKNFELIIKNFESRIKNFELIIENFESRIETFELKSRPWNRFTFELRIKTFALRINTFELRIKHFEGIKLRTNYQEFFKSSNQECHSE